MLKPTTYRALAPYLAMTVIIALLLVFGLKVPMSRLEVPYTFSGDDIDKTVQIATVAENGWLFHNDRLGYPFGYDRLDFPRFDSLNYAIMGPIAALTGEPGLALNLYFLAGFFLIAFAAYYAMGRLGLATGPALIGAIVYAFLPYHVYRGVGHVTNGAYFLIPLAFLMLTWIVRGQFERGQPDVRSRWRFALAIAFLLPLQTPYNGVFFAFLCAVTCALALARRWQWRAAWPALALSAAVGAAFIIELSPVLIHSRTAGEPSFVAARSPVEADALSLRFNQLLLPTINDPVRFVVKAKLAFDHAMLVDSPYTEVSNQYIGLLAILGFLALFWSLARSIAARAVPDTLDANDPEAAVRIGALFVIAILLLAMPGSIDTLIAYYVTAKIRAYNRILPFLAFPCVLAGAWVVQCALQSVKRRWLRNAMLVVAGLIAVWSVMILPRFDITQAKAIAVYDDYGLYFKQVEEQLGDGAAVFQDPVVWYPEHFPVNRMTDYQEFVPYLLTKTLRFSYGGAHGRIGYAWGRYVEKRPPGEMIQELHKMGFAAILIDGFSYADDASLRVTTDALKQLLPAQPSISADRRWWLFPLDGCCGPPIVQFAPGKAPRVFAVPIDGSPVTFDEAGAGWLYMTAGWWDPETWGTWASERTAKLRMKIDAVPEDGIALTLTARVFVGQKVQQRKLAVDANGRHLGEFTYGISSDEQVLHIEVPPALIKDNGLLELAFSVTPRTSPYLASGIRDERLLGVGLTQMSLTPAHAATKAP